VLSSFDDWGRSIGPRPYITLEDSRLTTTPGEALAHYDILMIALCATLPLAALIAPFIGIAVTVHLVQALHVPASNNYRSST